MDSKFSKQQKALLKAVEEGTLKSVVVLIECNGIKKDKKWFDYTLLMTALQREHKTIINYLLKQDIRVRKARKTDSDTPLHYAVALNDSKIVRTLVNKGASINDKNHKQETPFDLALREKKYEIVNVMLTLYNFKTVSINKNSMAHFHIACKLDNLATIKKFVSKKFPINSHADLSTENEWPESYTPLHFAVQNHSLNTIQFLLKSGADYSQKCSKNWTPVHLAYYSNYCHVIIEAMFTHSNQDKCINSIDETGLNHLHICCARNIPEIVKKFLENGEDINSFVSLDSNSNPGYTSLHFAIQNNHINIVEILLNHNASVNSKSQEGSTPLHLACELQHLEIIKLLLKFDADLTAKDSKNRTPLHCAFYAIPMLDIIDLLLLRIPKEINHTDHRGLSVFHIACIRNNVHIVEKFLQRGVSANSCLNLDTTYRFSGYSALHFAVNLDRILYHRVELSDTDEEEHENIDWTSSCKNQIKIIKLLLGHNADVNSKDSWGKTALIRVCEINEKVKINRCYYHQVAHPEKKSMLEEMNSRIKEIVHILLSNNADIHTRTHSGESILHVLSREEKLEAGTELAELFLSKGADVQASDELKVTPLHEAVKSGHDKIVEIFLNYNANINAKTIELMTPLHLTIKYLSFNLCHTFQVRKICELLLGKGCSVNEQNKAGETPLHFAFRIFDGHIVVRLFECGADINIEDFDGRSPLSNFNMELALDRTNRQRLYVCSAIINLVRNYVQILNVLGLYVSKTVTDVLSELYETIKIHPIREGFFFPFTDLSTLCTSELKRMKQLKIDNRPENLYSILLKDEDEMSRLAKNESVKSSLMADRLEEEFPHYGFMLKLQLRRGLERAAILENAKNILVFLTGFDLPDPCSERIFRYLTNKDLNNLIDCCTFSQKSSRC